MKCHTSLVGIPRQEDPFSKHATAKSQTALSEGNKYATIESVPHALWRTFRGSLVMFFLASLLTALICWVFDKRTLYDFGNALFYAAVVLAVIGWYIFRGNQQLVQSQLNPLNPMNRAMPGTHSERTRQHWRDYMEGMASVSAIGVSAALCFGVGWLIVSLVNRNTNIKKLSVFGEHDVILFTPLRIMIRDEHSNR